MVLDIPPSFLHSPRRLLRRGDIFDVEFRYAIAFRQNLGGLIGEIQTADDEIGPSLDDSQKQFDVVNGDASIGHEQIQNRCLIAIQKSAKQK